jgi:hypothetical protein
MSGHFSSSEGGRADDGPAPEPETPTAETAVLSTSHGDADVPPRPSRAARLRDAESVTHSEPGGHAEAPADGAAGASNGATAEAAQSRSASGPSLRRRTALRRRIRVLEARRDELLRDLGGLVFELSRRDRARPDLVQGKTAALGEVTGELESIAAELGGNPSASPAIATSRPQCPACGALHGAADVYCAACGADLRGTP